MDREEKIKKLLEEARKQIGKPYVDYSYLKSDDEKLDGFDCSSFSRYLFKYVGINLPRTSLEQAASPIGKEVKVEEIEPGDVIFFEGTKGHYWHTLFNKKKIYIGHLAIYTGNGSVIHAADNGNLNTILQGIVEHPLDILPKPEYDIVMIKRYL